MYGMFKEIPKLDLKDRKICYQLDLDARQSLGKIAKQVGLSKQVVAYRIKRLEELGVIKGYYTIMDIGKLGFIPFKVYLKFKDPDPTVLDKIIKYLTKHKSVAWVVTCNGEWDLNIVFQERSTAEFYDTYHDFLYRFSDHIREKDLAIPVEAMQFRRAYVLGNKQDDTKYDMMISPEPPKFDGDKTDWEILKILAPEARVELQHIADKVGLSAKAVSYRIKNLQKKGIIQSFRAMFDVSLLGYKYYKIFVGLRGMTQEKKNKLFTWLQMNPNIIYITKSIAKADYEFEMQARGRDEFHKLIREFLDEFSDIVRYVESLHYHEEHKFLYIPEVTPL
jgi:DNA-binding Lrp family transcriptional regulator